MDRSMIKETDSAALARPTRDVATDKLRLAVIVLVVFLHSALAYASFSRYDPAHYIDATAPVVDSSRWPLLDAPIMVIDTFGMPLLFLVSGLFVFSGLDRKGSGGYFLSRVKRLGIPFVVAAFTISPIAFLPGYLRSTPDSSVPYWIRFLTTDGWLIGAPWFLWVLLALDGIVAILHRTVPAVLDKLRREPPPLFILLATVVVFVPVVLALSPLPLFFLYFLLGMALGSSRRLDSGWPKYWGIWLLIGLFSSAADAAFGWYSAGLASRVVNGIGFAGSCAGFSLGLLGAFRRFGRGRIPVIDSLIANSFGIYLFHYPIVHWIQYALLPLAWPAQLKFCVVFLGALGLSWSVSALVRRIPAVRNII
jgi:glucan biosynthesis protein C